MVGLYSEEIFYRRSVVAGVAHFQRCNTCACDSSGVPEMETWDVSVVARRHGLVQRRCILLLPLEPPLEDITVAHVQMSVQVMQNI